MRNPNHPSFETVCEVQYSVNPRPTDWSMAGLGCGVTGGHCVPGEQCTTIRSLHAQMKAPRPNGGSDADD